MVMLPVAANTADNNQGMDDRSPIPAGDYQVHAIKSEFKETKAKNGHRLVFTLKVLEGVHKGHTLFVGLNLNNPNPEAVAVANKELNSMAQACGKVGVADSDELHSIPFIVSVTVKAATTQYPEGNEISAYKPVTSAPVAAPVAAPVVPAPVLPVAAAPVVPVAPVVNPVAAQPVAAPAPETPVAPVAPAPVAPTPGKLPWE